MTISELRKVFTHAELSRSPGDGSLRARAFTPILQNLHEGKVVYYEKFVCVARLENIQFTPKEFRATAVPCLQIERDCIPRGLCPSSPWKISGRWDYMALCGNSICGAAWSIWPDPATVRAVEQLAKQGAFKAALDLTLDEPLATINPDEI